MGKLSISTKCVTYPIVWILLFLVFNLHLHKSCILMKTNNQTQPLSKRCWFYLLWIFNVYNLWNNEIFINLQTMQWQLATWQVDQYNKYMANICLESFKNMVKNHMALIVHIKVPVQWVVHLIVHLHKCISAFWTKQQINTDDQRDNEN
jgi:hypothetical protein